MTPTSSAPTTTSTTLPVGGLIVAGWLLGDEVRTVNTKSGDKKTVLSLRDPRRLSNSLTLWLDGEAGPTLAAAALGVAVTLHLASVRSGRERGELSADVSREAVEAAFARATGAIGAGA